MCGPWTCFYILYVSRVLSVGAPVFCIGSCVSSNYKRCECDVSRHDALIYPWLLGQYSFYLKAIQKQHCFMYKKKKNVSNQLRNFSSKWLLRYCLSAIQLQYLCAAFISCFLDFLPFCMCNLVYWQWFCRKNGVWEMCPCALFLCSNWCRISFSTQVKEYVRCLFK